MASGGVEVEGYISNVWIANWPFDISIFLTISNFEGIVVKALKLIVGSLNDSSGYEVGVTIEY